MTDDELKRLLEALRQDSSAAHAETRRLFGETADRIATENQHFFATGAEGLRHGIQLAFMETADRIATENQHFFAIGAEGLRHEIQLVTEGVSATREALNREAADIREEVRRTASDTQAMIKFSHAELDRRMSTLEDTQNKLEEAITDLQARVERLERPAQ
ncbi:MAG: hypothetical protein JWO56_2888 [Acidobacteria bacterium]|nr:hypothetical protein [Acidobacteriota bacterium]